VHLGKLRIPKGFYGEKRLRRKIHYWLHNISLMVGRCHMLCSMMVASVAKIGDVQKEILMIS
jgi:hypothetical membrane protein